jgi:Ca-activated chloride channel family protein
MAPIGAGAEPMPAIDAAPVEPSGERTLSPYFVVGDAEANLPLERTQAQVRVAGAIADVTVTQTYRNEGKRPIEAIYVFPASTRAAVHGLTMTIGQRVVRATIREREAARRAYQAARNTGHTASLLEQQRPNVFTMHVANILPDDRIVVELRYAELLVPTDGVYELDFPTVVGPRYSNKTEKAPSPNDPEGGGNIDSHDRFVRSPYLPPGTQIAAARFGLEATIESPVALSALDCPSHKSAQTARVSPRQARLTVPESEEGGNRDVRIRYTLAGGAIETGLIVEPGADANHFVLMMAPPARVEPAAILPREYVFVVDVSGSMWGFPLEVARHLVERMLTGLRPQDRFNILTFSGGSEVLAEHPVRADEEGKARALRFLASQHAGGGTELLPAIQRVLALPREARTSRSIVVVTDGYVEVEKEAFDLIRGSLDRTNLFAFGIGTSVNRYLIEGLARVGQGESFVASDQAEAEKLAERFATYVRAPVLTDARLRFEGLDAYDVEPEVLPDLFVSRPIVVTGKYRGALAGRALLTGTTAERSIEQALDLASAQRSSGQGLAQLWARARIARLDDLGRAGDATHKDEVTRLGLGYHLMTAYTSFVAVDDERRTAPVKPETVRQPSPLPEGVSAAAVAQQAGLLGTISSEHDDPLGGLIGNAVGESYGTIGLGHLGTIGKGGGGGGIGYGHGAGGLGGRRAGAPDVELGAATVTGSLDREVIRRIIRRHINEVKFVFEKELLKQPGLNGTVVLRFTIDARGTVTSATVASSTLNNPAVEQGLAAAITRWEFPRPAGGGRVVVTYPFQFVKAR